MTVASYLVSGLCLVYALTLILSRRPFLLRRRDDSRLHPLAVRIYGAGWLVYVTYFAALPTLAAVAEKWPVPSYFTGMLGGGAAVLLFASIALCAWLVDRNQSPEA